MVKVMPFDLVAQVTFFRLRVIASSKAYFMHAVAADAGEDRLLA